VGNFRKGLQGRSKVPSSFCIGSCWVN